MSEAADATSEADDELVVTLSDYLDGALAEAERKRVADKVAADAEWKRVHDELVEQRKMISGLRKAHVRPTFTDDVAATISKRSGGRFFGKRTLGDRVPFGAILIVALVALAAVMWLMRSSDGGSDKREGEGSSERIMP
jgi:anti-sigma factor RsiW